MGNDSVLQRIALTKILRITRYIGLTVVLLATLTACGEEGITSQNLTDALAAAQVAATVVAGSEDLKGVVTAVEGVATAVAGQDIGAAVTAAQAVAAAVAEAGGVQGVAQTLSGLLEVRVTDAPPEGVTSIVVTVNNIQVHQAGAADEESGWLTLFAITSTTSAVVNSKTFDLVEFTGIEGVLGVGTLPVGKYNADPNEYRRGRSNSPG